MADGDAERTRLANERTYLAWWRTGIAGIAAGFAVGRIVPEVVEGQSWTYVAVGAALTATGALAFVYGAVRYRELDAALREGREPARHDSAVLVLAAGRRRGRDRVDPARPLRALRHQSAFAVAGERTPSPWAPAAAGRATRKSSPPSVAARPAKSAPARNASW